MPFSEEELMRDLASADAVGDTQLATKIAGHIKAARSTAAQDASMRAKGGASDTGDSAFDFTENVAAGAGKALTDMWLGGKQLVNSVSGGLIGDKAALAKEAAEKERLDKALMSTGGGMVGKYGTDIASSFLPMGLASKAIKGAGMLPGMARAAGAGAAQNLAVPEEDYNPLKQAATGAAFGFGGDVVGRGLGRLYAPFRNAGAGAAAKENAATLNAAGLPKQIPATQTDNSVIQAMTNALEQIPIIGGGIRNARAKNAGWLTERATAPTGMAVNELTPSSRQGMADAVEQQFKAIRSGPDVPTGEMPAKLKALVDELSTTPTLTSKATDVNRLDRLGNELTPRLNMAPERPGVYNTIDKAMVADPNYPVGHTLEQVASESMPQRFGNLPTPTPSPSISNTTRTADEMMNLRNEAADLAFGNTNKLQAKTARELKTHIEDAIRATHGDKGAAFDQALKQWGALKDVERAAGKGGKELVGGHLTPERLAMNLDDSFRNPSEMDKLISAAAENMPSPPKGWNRAMLTSALLGAPILGGAGADLTRGDFGAGTAGGLGTSAALIAGLSRQVPAQARIDALRKALTAAGIGTGMQF